MAAIVQVFFVSDKSKLTDLLLPLPPQAGVQPLPITQ
jgi:hypothetical protein